MPILIHVLCQSDYYVIQQLFLMKSSGFRFVKIQNLTYFSQFICQSVSQYNYLILSIFVFESITLQVLCF